MPFCAYCGSQVAVISNAPCPSCGRPANGAPAVVAGGGVGKGPMVLIIVLVGGLFLVAFLGILAAIAIPNLLSATQRSKQKRTMADLRSLGTAVEAWATDQNKYPEAPDLEQLEQQLVPTYIKTLPKKDGWGNGFRYDCWVSSGTGGCDSYAIASSGKDGAFEKDNLRDYLQGGATTNFNNDIVFSNGEFVQYPSGFQGGN